MAAKLTTEVLHLFAHENRVANRVVASAYNHNFTYSYSLWVDGHVDCTRQERADRNGFLWQHHAETIPRPKGLEWIINDELTPRQRAYVYMLLFGEKIKRVP